MESQEQVASQQPQVEEQRENVAVKADPFAGGWSETPPELVVIPAAEQPKAAEQAAAKVEEEEILDPKQWLQREFQIEDPEILKNQIKEYRELKDKKPEEVKFENEQSKKIYEILKSGKTENLKELKEFLETQERLNHYSSTEVSKDTAPEIIKMAMQLQNKLLTKEDIEFQYKELYTAPKEPVQRLSEPDEEFQERHSEWSEKVANIEYKKIVAAKMAMPELEKLKSQIVLPEISLPKTNEPSPEVLAQQEEQIGKMRELFLNKLESDYVKFEGFNTKVKDESVEIPVAFKAPDEDKAALKQRLKEGFDVQQYMDQRWFSQDGSPKIEQIMSDIYQLENAEKIFAGIANNAANQRLVHYRKEASKIDVNGGTAAQQTFTNQNGNSVSPYAQGAWSEKPPVLTN